MNGRLSPSTVKTLAVDMPHGVVRFVESGRVAVWDASIRGYLVTGYGRAWGDRVELVKTFGPYEVILDTLPPHPLGSE